MTSVEIPIHEHIVQGLPKQQENEMRSPSSEGSSPLTDCGESCVRVGCGYFASSTTAYHTAPQASPSPNSGDSAMEKRLGGGASGKGGKMRRARSKSLGSAFEATCNSVDDCHTAPLMFHDIDDSLCRKSIRRKALRHLGNLLGCFFRIRPECSQRRAWTKSRALALLELSQQQQSALAVKQGTIEMLEWKLEQLQLQSAAGGGSHRSSAIVGCSETPIVPSLVGDDDSKRFGDAASIASDDGVQDRMFSSQTQAHEASLGVQSNGDLCATMQLFQMAAIKARLAVRYFCKVFMKQMEASGYSVWRTLAEIEPATKFLNKEHTAFILESRLNKALFHSFENDSFDETGLTRIINHAERCAVRFHDFQRLKLVDAATAVNTQHEAFDPEFWAFCENKMREMWFLFPWNVVFKDSDERSSFTGAFLDAAKCVWLLHRLAFSVHPSVSILRVGKGMEANSLYVEQVTPIDEGCKKCDRPKVEFMSMPGFQIRNRIIKCQVYRHLQCK